MHDFSKPVTTTQILNFTVSRRMAREPDTLHSFSTCQRRLYAGVLPHFRASATFCVCRMVQVPLPLPPWQTVAADISRQFMFLPSAAVLCLKPPCLLDDDMNDARRAYPNHKPCHDRRAVRQHILPRDAS